MEDKIVIIGASITGTYTATALVKDGFEGRITLIERQDVLPYNTYPLSKEWMQDPNDMDPPLLKKATYYEDKGITLKLGTEVSAVDPGEQTVTTATGDVIPYDKLVIATGSKLRTLSVEGDDASGIFYLRGFEDALAIKAWSREAKHVTIIGSGFIGLELASTFRQLGLEVSVLVRSGKPLDKILGLDASAYFVDMHRAHGVNFLYGEEAAAFTSDDEGHVRAMRTKTGQTIETDMVIIAVGVMPNLPFDLDVKTDRGTITVNRYGETSVPNIYAGGDIASWPYQGESIHVEHWETAWSQAMSIAKNFLAPRSSAYDVLPYFWTDQYNQTFEYLGRAETWDHTLVRGSLQDREFCIAYVDAENRPLAVLFANKAAKRSEVEALLRSGEALDTKRFADLSIPL